MPRELARMREPSEMYVASRMLNTVPIRARIASFATSFFLVVARIILRLSALRAPTAGPSSNDELECLGRMTVSKDPVRATVLNVGLY